MLNLLKHEIQSRIGAIAGWGIGLALFGAMYIAIYPEAGEQMKALAGLQLYQAMGLDLGSFEGFIASSVIQFTPVILGIYAVIAGTETLAGEEDNGTLEIIISMPMYRWQIVAVKALAISLTSFLALVIAGVGNAAVLNMIRASAQVDVTASQMLAATLSCWPLILAFVMIGMFAGAYLPSRRIAALATTIVFIASYFGETLSGFAPSLDAVKPLSLFYYFDSSANLFIDGVQAQDVVTLLIIAAVFLILTLLSFQRRSITVGAWPWNRSRVKR